jgi:ABC-type branched-subunit amino acid transport system substrate-binding protein
VRRALPILLAAVAASASLSACGDEQQEPTRVRGDTLSIYASLPAHGVEARAGDAAALGMRQALAEAGARSGGRDVRLVLMPSTRAGDESWDPGTVEANADRASSDPTTIAYLGELDRGASAVSLPVTNRERILQVSPADALTSLTRRPPGRPRAGPERYYPGELRSFIRLVAPDLVAARGIVAEIATLGIRRLAIVSGDGIADRELEGMIIGLIGEGRPRTITRVTAPDREDSPESVPELVDELTDAEPEAIVYAAPDGPRTRAALAAISASLPTLPLILGPALGGNAPASAAVRACMGASAAPEDDLSSRDRRRLKQLRDSAGQPDLGVEALLGYDAMRLTLAAIDEAGPDRVAVTRAAKALWQRFSPCRSLT